MSDHLGSSQTAQSPLYDSAFSTCVVVTATLPSLSPSTPASLASAFASSPTSAFSPSKYLAISSRGVSKVGEYNRSARCLQLDKSKISEKPRGSYVAEGMAIPSGLLTAGFDKKEPDDTDFEGEEDAVEDVVW